MRGDTARRILNGLLILGVIGILASAKDDTVVEPDDVLEPIVIPPTPVIPEFLPFEKVYVANTGSNSISVIDAETDSLLTTISIGVKPFAIAPSKTDATVYVSSKEGQAIVAINALTDQVKAIYVLNVPMTNLAAGFDSNVYAVTLVQKEDPYNLGFSVGRLTPASGISLCLLYAYSKIHPKTSDV